MTEQTWEQIEGVEGLVGVRLIEYEGKPCLEAEPQDDRYRMGPFAAPPIVRLELENTDPGTVAHAKSLVPNCLTQMMADAG